MIKTATGIVCSKCGGTGRLTYATTGTYMGGIAGQAMTEDTCDKCWASGLESHKGTDMRAVFKAQDTIVRAWRKHTTEAVTRATVAERTLLKISQLCGKLNEGKGAK